MIRAGAAMQQDDQATAIAAAWQVPERRLSAWPGTPPRDVAEGYRLQRAVAARVGPVRGRKGGAGGGGGAPAPGRPHPPRG